MKHLVTISLSFWLILSCKNTQNQNDIYFGGEIINPKSDIITLLKNDKVIDTIPLKSDNTFGKNLKNIAPGLYYFQHGNEFQYVYFEPKDSIKIRLNTWDFDESLVFDGRGSEKNDFLLNVFLINEKEMNNFYSYFPLSETDFSKKYDEIFQQNTNVLTQFLTDNPDISLDFKHLAQASIKYPLYSFKELYPYYHKKLTDSIEKVSPEFYDFRKSIDFNDTSLSEYYAYQNYILYHLYNEAFKLNDYKGFDENFKKHLFRLIADKIKINDLKNRLLYQETNACIFHSDKGINPENLEIFYKNCTDSVLTHKIKTILKSKDELAVNTSLPDFSLKGYDEKKYFSQQIIKNKYTVLYFWLNDSMSNDYIYNRVKYLTKSYPNVQFIGIYPDQNSFVESNIGFSQKYYLPKDSEGQKLYSPNFPRTIIIDNKGKVINNFTLLTDNSIEKTLTKLL